MSGPGRDQRGPMERLVRIAAVLKVAGETGVTAERLLDVAGFTGEHADDLLARDLKLLRQQGWQIDNVSPPGSPARYRMVTVDNRFRVRLTPEQQTALQRAVLLADRADLVQRLGLPATEQPGEVRAALAPRTHDQRLSAVMHALRHRCVLRFRYNGKDRVVHPESVRSQNEHWYLRGVEDDTDVLKAFVVSRMSAVTAGRRGTARAVEAEPVLTLHPMRWQVDPPVDVVLRTTAAYRPDVERWLGEPASVRTVSDGADGGDVEMTYVVTHRAALRCRLHELGRRVHLVGPDEVRHEIVDDLRAVVSGADA